MRLQKITNNRGLRIVSNVLFFGMLFMFLFNPSAKAWLLKSLMTVGLFKAEIRKEAPAMSEPASALAFQYRDEKGNRLSTASLKGKVVFVNFWATWCPPCRAEMPALYDLYNQFRDDDRVVFLFLNEDEDPAKGKDYLESNGFSMPLVTSEGNVPAEIYSGTLPTTVVLNRDGKIVFKHEGLARYNTAEFINQLRALL